MKVTILLINALLPLLTTAIAVPQPSSLIEDESSSEDDRTVMVAGNDIHSASTTTKNYNNYIDDNYNYDNPTLIDDYYNYDNPTLIDDNYNYNYDNPTLVTIEPRAVSVVARGTSPISTFDFSAGDSLYCDAEIGVNRNSRDHRVVALPTARFPHLLDRSWCGRRITLTYHGLTSNAIIGDRCGPSCVRKTIS